MPKIRLRYIVEYDTELEIGSEDVYGILMSDILKNISIPENETSKYVEESFDVISCLNEEAEEIEVTCDL